MYIINVIFPEPEAPKSEKKKKKKKKEKGGAEADDSVLDSTMDTSTAGELIGNLYN